MVEIRNRGHLAAFLNGRPYQWAPIIAVRAALRVLPLRRKRRSSRELPLAALRALFVSRAALQFGGHEIVDAAHSAAVASNAVSADICAIRAAEAAYGLGKYASLEDALGAVEASANTAYAAINLRNFVYNGAYATSFSEAPADLPESEMESDASAFASEAALSASKAASSAIWKSVQEDASFLEREGGDIYAADILLLSPLWKERPYRNILRCWDDLKNDLLASSDMHWEPWVQWYDACLAGGAISFPTLTIDTSAAFCRQLASETAGFWERDVAIVNAEIAERLNAGRDGIPAAGSRKMDSTGRQADTAIPSVQPALIEAEVVLGRVRLIEEPVAVSMDIEDFGDLMDALRHEGDRLLARVGSLANTDERILSTLSEAVNYLKTPVTSKVNLFLIGHRHEVLRDYVDIVKSEWPDVYAADFNAFLKLYERTVRQAPKWQAMLRNAHEHHLSPRETKAALEAVGNFAKAAAEEPLIDGGIAEVINQSLDVLPAKEPDIVEISEQGIGEGYELLAADLLEGVNNVLKVMAREITRPLAELSSKMVIEFKERAGKSLVEAAGRMGDGVGDNLTKIPKALAKILGWTSAGYGGGTVLGEFLLHTFPTQFGWLAQVMKLLAPFLSS